MRKFKKATEVVLLPFVSATARGKMVPRSSYFHADSDTKIDGKKKKKERERLDAVSLHRWVQVVVMQLHYALYALRE